MIIRSLTYTIDLSSISNSEYIIKVKNDLEYSKKIFLRSNIKIRTIRFNIIPLNNYFIIDNKNILRELTKLSEISNELNVRWFDISFDLTNESKANVDILCELGYEILKNFYNSFVNFIIAREYINNYAAIKTSKIIKKVSILSPNGVDNFRLGVSLNVDANTPFFPFSYSDKNESFSIALETTTNFIEMAKNLNSDYTKLKKGIINNLKPDLALIEKLSATIAKDLDLKYNGMDLSLSPFPYENTSVIELLSILGVDEFGSNGTQFLTSYLTSILKELILTAGVKVVGFNGVMYSLLEDVLMCEAHNNGNFSIDSIILYSTVCGCGLDMVPLPCDVLEEEIASMILDVATTSIKLNKPLGVRVLPIPGKYAGEFTDLKLDFLTNTKIPTVKHMHINPSLFGIEKFYVKL
jgi:uncharacterized protein